MTTLLLIHIVSFSISLVLLPALLIASVTRYVAPAALRFGSLVATTVGLATGSALLIASPSGAYCAMLFCYVVVFAVFYLKSGSLQRARKEALVKVDR